MCVALAVALEAVAIEALHVFCTSIIFASKDIEDAAVLREAMN